MGSWGRIAPLLGALCVLAAACGDSDVDIRTHGPGVISPGFFIGETDGGGDLSIDVGSIRSVFFDCDGTVVFQRFDPPEPVAADGSFGVDIDVGSQRFTVTGRFTDDDTIQGSIDGDPDCDGEFTARRCRPSAQDCGDDDGDTIPDEIDPSQGGSTPTPGHTSTPGAATATTAAATPTASATPVPSPTGTPSGLCGNDQIDDDEECDGTDLDDNTCFDLCFDQEDEGGTLSCNSNCTFNFSQCLGTDCSS